MRRILLAGLMGASVAGGARAQSTAAPAATAPGAPTPTQVSNTFPAGTVIAVELSKSLDAKKAKVGDKIEARIPADLLAHGKIVIPRSAKIFGQVTEVKAHSKESPDSKLGVAFDRLVLKDGHEVSLQAVVQAISRPLQPLVASDSRISEGGSMPAGDGSTSGSMGSSRPSRSTERVAAIPIDGPEPTSTLAPLGPTSQGVVGMKGLALQGSGQSSVLSNAKHNVHLDTGTHM